MVATMTRPVRGLPYTTENAESVERKACSVEGCQRPYSGKGYCLPHYARWRRNGDPGIAEVVHVSGSDFWENVVKGDGCWEWVGPKNDSGYGVTFARRIGRREQAHRVAWELQRGPIPDGLQIDHLCRNRACVNPDHLEPVTQRENLIRGMGTPGLRYRATHCVNGHLFDEANTYITKWGTRNCRACSTQRVRDLRTRRRAA
jgi:hypothetical protein